MATVNPGIESDEAQLPTALIQRNFRKLSWQRAKEKVIFGLLTLCTLFTLLITAAIIVLMVKETFNFFSISEIAIWEFLFGTTWNPLISEDNKQYGVLPLVCGTLWITLIAMLVALPLGLVTAIYLSEYAPAKLRATLKPMLEILAGIPTVVYGLFALTFITPLLRAILSPLGIEIDFFNAASAGVAVGILCLPIVTSLSEDALRAVPNRLREAAYGLGGTKFDVSTKVVVPAALSGIISAFILAVARAIGETMIVALAAGQLANITPNPFSQIQTMTGYMTQAAKGDISNFGPEYYSLYAVAATLFAITFGLTVLGNIVRKRYQEVYE